MLSSCPFFGSVSAQTADSIAPKPKLLGSVLRTVRTIDMTNDTIAETLQIETTKAKRIKDVKVRFGIYQGNKKMYEYSWRADDFFDPKDKLPDTLKWLRLQRIIRVFFSDQNFSDSNRESLDDIFERVRPVDILGQSPEALEFQQTPHKVFSVYAGRDLLLGITWLESKKKFLTLWRN
ncbi:MAG: hypothetical protein ABI778_08865 [Ignavibacteriota bacterium]